MTRTPWMALVLAVLVACTGDDGKQRRPVDDGGDGVSDDDTDTTDEDDGDTEDLVGAHDGAYTVTVQRAGDHFGIGRTTVQKNELLANFISNSGMDVTVEGRVEADGTIVPLYITTNIGAEVEILEARIQGGIIEATYTIEGEEGVLVGTKDGQLIDQVPVRDFDGSYALSMVRADEEVATTVLDIKRGRFKSNITNVDGAAFDIAGFVTSDGVIVLSDGTSSTVIAEASIDQDSGEIEGIYQAGDLVGRVYGRRSD